MAFDSTQGKAFDLHQVFAEVYIKIDLSGADTRLPLIRALAVLKGVLFSKHLKRRFRRDVGSTEEDVAAEIAVAQKMDSAGCVAKLLCEIEAMSADQLTPAMSTFKTAFEDNQTLKGSRGVYDLAITFGSKFAKKDAKACGVLFENCVLSRDELSAMLDYSFSC
ncbi:hypothetical protein C7M84_010426 [Penaeus vannamei]|uniref:Uncharacterized protein n=1 Tax=Penaeus vannamei TaxID=6689 RepID=A0A3R7PGS4_PENVA|nr:hypothetical protein C7M84_010426 [Penaeus vannamei]